MSVVVGAKISPWETLYLESSEPVDKQCSIIPVFLSPEPPRGDFHTGDCIHQGAVSSETEIGNKQKNVGDNI